MWQGPRARYPEARSCKFCCNWEGQYQQVMTWRPIVRFHTTRVPTSSMASAHACQCTHMHSCPCICAHGNMHICTLPSGRYIHTRHPMRGVCHSLCGQHLTHNCHPPARRRADRKPGSLFRLHTALHARTYVNTTQVVWGVPPPGRRLPPGAHAAMPPAAADRLAPALPLRPLRTRTHSRPADLHPAAWDGGWDLSMNTSPHRHR